MLAVVSILVKAGLYVGVLGTVGFATHRVAMRLESRKLIAASVALLVLCVALRLLVLNAELAGGLARMFDFSQFVWIWSPNKAQFYGYLAGSGVVLVGVMAGMRSMVILGAVVVLVGVGLGGHTRGLDNPGLSPWIVSIHVGIAAFWVTAPVTLWPSSDVNHNEIVYRMERFSAIAIRTVPLMFAGGLWLGVQLTGSIYAFIASGYGLLLMTKLLLACGALAIGVANKFWIAKILQNKQMGGRVFLQRALTVDSVLFAGIVIAIASATSVTGPGA
ncbi:MAG: CopD family protein [Halieaceae bacterium]|jgi:putative copper resistance protein D